jgi:hypothetical protein
MERGSHLHLSIIDQQMSEYGVSDLRAALKAAYLTGESPVPGIAYLPG